MRRKQSSGSNISLGHHPPALTTYSLARGNLGVREKHSRAKTSVRVEVRDYILTDSDGRRMALSDLFGEKEDLILIHNMGRSCSYCTMWADGFNGVLDHLEDRAAFAVVSPDASPWQKQFAKSRGWRFRMVSSKGTTFSKDMGFENKQEGPEPGVSVFHKDRRGRIFRVAKDEFGPGDEYCIVWHFFGLLPGGSKGWEPKFRYG